MALSFPSNPNVGDTYLSYIWDGTKWGVQAGVGGVAGVSSFNTRVGAVVLALGDVTSATGSGSTAQASLGLATVAASGAYADLSGAPSLAPYAPLAAPVFTGDARAVTATAGDNDTSIATTAFVAATLRYGNTANNSGFAVNQRTYVSGTALAAGVYAHDRWKAGAGGCTYTFTQSGGPFTTITITAGTLQQVVEGLSLVGGTYVLSWTGTAQGRIGAASYAASPVTAAVTAGTNATLEFNAGTLGQVKFEVGSVATPLEKPDPQQDLAKCQRFYEIGTTKNYGYNTAGNPSGTVTQYKVTKRTTPTVTLTNSGGTVNVGAASTLDVSQPDMFAAYRIATVTGQTNFSDTFTASADL